MDALVPGNVLLISAGSIALVHALAPDHWIPFVSIGRARGWSVQKLVGVSVVSGVGHVVSSIALGFVGLLLGLGLSSLESAEGTRATIAGLALITFGIVYAGWGLYRANRHTHDVPVGRSVTIWTLVAVFVLGPCEPLIPLMFASAAHGWGTVVAVTALFAVITIAMMAVQSVVVFLGLNLVPGLEEFSHRYGHAMAGAVIVLTGLAVMALGI